MAYQQPKLKIDWLFTPLVFKFFDTAKRFASWLRLAPNNRISGGKVLSNKIPKGSNRLKIALRNAANAIGNLKDTHLSNFFKRISFRRGRAAAISATARKLAIIIWNMVVKAIPYSPPTIYEFLDQKRKRKVAERNALFITLTSQPMTSVYNFKSTNCKTLVRIINRPFKCKTNFISISILFDGLPRTMMAENNSRKNVFSL